MSFEVNSHSFKNAINKLLSVVNKKTSKQILTNFLFEYKENTLNIMASDLDIFANIQIESSVKTPGKFCISSKNISDIARELPNDLLSFEFDNETNLLSISCNRINFTLTTSSPDEFPKMAAPSDIQEFEINSQQLAKILNTTSHAISNDETRLFLNGIFMQVIDSKLRTVAIDGHRLALFDTEDFTYKNDALINGIIIPKKGVYELKKLAENLEIPINIYVDDSFLYARTHNEFLSIRLITREYPKYQSVIPDKSVFSFRTNREHLLNAVKRIKILSNEQTNGIKLKFLENRLELTAHHATYGNAQEVVEAEYLGDETEISLNAKYILDTLSVLEDGEIILEFNNSLSPIVIKSEKMSQFLGIIMPLRM